MAEKKKSRWIKRATAGAHGQFAARAEKAGETTKEFAAEKADAPGKLGKEARLASTLMSMSRKRSTSRYAEAKGVRRG